MIVDRGFGMMGTAQERFRDELGPQIKRMGFKLARDEPGLLVYEVSYVVGSRTLMWVATSWLTILYWLRRRLARQRIEISFEPDGESTGVHIYAHVGRRVARALDALGRPGHWPDDAEDPDWITIPAADDSWVDEVDMATADRMTKRAAKRARSGR